MTNTDDKKFDYEYKTVRNKLKTSNKFVLKLLMVEIGIDEETRNMIICKFINELSDIKMEERFFRTSRSINKKIEKGIKKICNTIKCYKYQPKQIQEYIILIFDDFSS